MVGDVWIYLEDGPTHRQNEATILPEPALVRRSIEHRLTIRLHGDFSSRLK